MRNELSKQIQHSRAASGLRESLLAAKVAAEKGCGSACESAVPLRASSSFFSCTAVPPRVGLNDQNQPAGYDHVSQQQQQTEDKNDKNKGDVDDAAASAVNVKGISDKDDAATASGTEEDAREFLFDDDADDFMPAKKQRTGPLTPTTVTKGSIVENFLKKNDVRDVSDGLDVQGCSASPCVGLAAANGNQDSNPTSSGTCCQQQQPAAPKPPRKSVPKIFYGTRTHKQIKQIIRELKKTAYKDVKMCILASRETTCIHELIAHDSGKAEACRKLLRTTGFPGGGCRFHQGARRITTLGQLANCGLGNVWDIEDLVKTGRRRAACPYFIIQNVYTDAQIIFCPYQYLIDAQVRMAMSLNIKNSIVILDEAHNIEDSARESASFSVTDDDLKEIIKNLNIVGEKVADQMEDNNYFLDLATMMSTLLGWLVLNSENLTDDSINQSSLVISGVEAMTALEDIGLGKDQLDEFMSNVDLAVKFVEKSDTQPTDAEDQQSTDVSIDEPMRSLAAQTLFIGKGLSMIFFNFLRSEKRFVNDYKVTFLKTISTNFKTPIDQFVNRNSVSFALSLNFWCLNPAVSFVDLKERCRSIVLTSGTLAPTDSFQSELDSAFPIKLETNHVVEKSQVWIGALGAGPTSTQLQATYANTESFAFQDELGRVLLKVCETVPHGVLFFVSSYYLVEKLQSRWQATGLLDEISKHKSIFCEERGSNKASFDNVLSEYYEVVSTGKTVVVKDRYRRRTKEAVRPIGGALLLAVFRGKVSEGLDFSDNYARAVITVGIPFPGIKDLQVSLKRKYNDAHTQSHGLLNGSKWYEIQAFRALNQALGRCIRHRNDWGALIIIDSRFFNSTMYTNNLSKWIRGNLQRYPDFHFAMDSLKEFVALQKTAEQSRPIQPLSAKQDDIETQESTVALTSRFPRSSSSSSTPRVRRPRWSRMNKAQNNRSSYFFNDDDDDQTKE